MVFRRAFILSVALLLAGQAHAAPFFVKTSGLTARSAAPLDTIERSIPSEIAVRAPDGIVIPFSKREEEELLRRQDNSSIPSNSTSPNNITVVIDNSPPAPPPSGNLNKVNPNNVPEEQPAQSPNGVVQPFTKREGRLFGRQDNSSVPANSTSPNNVTVVIDNSPPAPPPDGNLNKVNPNNVPEEQPAQSPNGIVQPYTKRAFGRRDNSTTTNNSTSTDNSTSTCGAPDGSTPVDNSPPPPVPAGNDNGLNPENISDNEPTSAPNGIVVPLKQRFISSEIPTRSLNGEIELYN